jgi:hypothetical protein
MHITDALKDCYEVLGIQPGASLEEIKRAYKKAVKSCHPDIGGTAPQMRVIHSYYKRLIAYESSQSSSSMMPPVAQETPIYRDYTTSYGYGNRSSSPEVADKKKPELKYFPLALLFFISSLASWLIAISGYGFLPIIWLSLGMLLVFSWKNYRSIRNQGMTIRSAILIITLVTFLGSSIGYGIARVFPGTTGDDSNFFDAG